MAKGLPWVGSSGKKPSAAAQYTPPGGHPGPDAVSATGGASSVNQFVHPSLKGEQHPDQSSQGTRTYG